MKRVVGIIAVSSLVVLSCKETTKAIHYEPKPEIVAVEDSTGYDSLLAMELGADDYGMKQYVMAFLKEGPNRDQDSTEVQEIQRAHLDNITRLAEEGTLVLAGPFMDEGAIRGIYVFNVASPEEADSLAQTDPAVQAGRLLLEFHPWYGSAAVMKIKEIHGRIAKMNI